jgi:hypothetical protein
MLGKGYRINMICDKQNVQAVKELMKTAMPNGIFQESSGSAGGMVYDLPFEYVKQLGPIFSLMDNKKAGAKSSNAAIESL